MPLSVEVKQKNWVVDGRVADALQGAAVALRARYCSPLCIMILGPDDSNGFCLASHERCLIGCSCWSRVIRISGALRVAAALANHLVVLIFIAVE